MSGGAPPLTQSPHEPIRLADAAEETFALGGKTLKSFHNLCPEVSFDVFGLFATTVTLFADELDREFRNAELVRERSRERRDWRWDFELIVPMYFSQCPVYLGYSMTQARLSPP
jgi:hypothetical protein